MLIVYTTLLLILFYSYNRWPENFLFNGELRDRHFQLERKDIEAQIAAINESEQLLNQEKAELSYIYTEILQLKESDSVKYLQFFNGNRLFMNDSIILVFHYEFNPPGSEPVSRVFVHTNTGEEIKSFALYGNRLIQSLKNRLDEIDFRLSKSSTNLAEENRSFNDSELSLLSFISYYSKDQIQPLTTVMKCVDLVAKIMGWVFFGVIANEVVQPIFKRFKRS